MMRSMIVTDNRKSAVFFALQCLQIYNSVLFYFRSSQHQPIGGRMKKNSHKKPAIHATVNGVTLSNAYFLLMERGESLSTKI